VVDDHRNLGAGDGDATPGHRPGRAAPRHAHRDHLRGRPRRGRRGPHRHLRLQLLREHTYNDFHHYVDRAPNWRNECPLRSPDHALIYDVTGYMPRIAPTPLLMILTGVDITTPTDLALEAFDMAHEPGGPDHRWPTLRRVRQGVRADEHGGGAVVRHAPLSGPTHAPLAVRAQRTTPGPAVSTSACC
jgi:hypothetical protein